MTKSLAEEIAYAHEPLSYTIKNDETGEYTTVHKDRILSSSSLARLISYDSELPVEEIEKIYHEYVDMMKKILANWKDLPQTGYDFEQDWDYSDKYNGICDVFAKIAAHHSTPLSILGNLSSYDEGIEEHGWLSGPGRIRTNVARNVRAPLFILKFLMKDDDACVRKTAEEQIISRGLQTWTADLTGPQLLEFLKEGDSKQPHLGVGPIFFQDDAQST